MFQNLGDDIMNNINVNPHMKYGFIGLGLIGASIAKALRRVYSDCYIIAYNRSESARTMALNDGVANEVTDKVDETFKDCDYIFLCTPVEYNLEYLKILKTIIKPTCIITDVGSVKAGIHKAVIELNLEANFIGGHPMAGSEKTGYESSTDRLVENAFYVITPTLKTKENKLLEYKAIAEAIGAIPIILDYDQHDYAVAGISHLPHIIAVELVNLVKASDSDNGIMKLIAAGGFKDITRIASSSPEMWEQIFMTNTDNIISLLDDYINMLGEVKSNLLDKNGSFINERFRQSREYRDQFTDSSRNSMVKMYTIYVDIVDEIGTLACVVSLLSSKGLSIKNIRIVNNRELDAGVLAIDFKDESSLTEAAKILEAHHYKIYQR